MNPNQKFLIQLADTAFIQSHRLQETVGNMPKLEIEMALCNMGLDLLGQSRFLYQIVAKELDNTNEDTLALQRDSWDIYNLLMAELPNKEFDSIIAKNYFLAQFTLLLYRQVEKSTALEIKSYAQKSLKELQYHLEYFSGWLIRLGDGTEYSHERMQNSVNHYWDYVGEFFTPVDYEANLDADMLPINLKEVEKLWHAEVDSVLAKATLKKPEGKWSQQSGKIGKHTEHHGFILAETQYVQRAYPKMEW